MGCKSKRRDFLKQSVYMGAGLLGLGYMGGVSEVVSIGSSKPASSSELFPEANPKAKSRVVIHRNDRVRGTKGDIDVDVMSHMLDAALQRLTGAGSSQEAWRHFCRPKDVVGIKVNCLAGKGLSTHPELVEAIVVGLRSAGVKEHNIIIWDRLTEDLKRAGFKVNMKGKGVRCYGNDAPGADYERRLTDGQTAVLAKQLVNLLEHDRPEVQHCVWEALVELAQAGAPVTHRPRDETSHGEAVRRWRAYWEQFERQRVSEPRAASYMKMARSLESAGKKSVAAARYRRVISEFPSSSAAEEARRRLLAIESD